MTSEAFQEHTFTLSNHTTSVQYFDIYTSSSYFFITDVQAPCHPSHGTDGMIAVKPHGRVRVNMSKVCITELLPATHV